ncbi:MAG TPA: hypothetical protein VF576_06305 [Rubricoccaceae bacterium]|jgi:hypothetical protein
MTRAVLVAALAALPVLAPAAQQMRPDAAPVGGTLRLESGRAPELVDLLVRPASTTGMDECLGYVDPSTPDVVVEWAGGDLRMTTRASFDATLVVSKPDGTWACNDDGEGLAPVVEVVGAPRGRYAVWVGSLAETVEDRAVTLIAGRAGPPAAPDADARPTGGTVRVEAGFEQEDGPSTTAVRAGGLDAVASMGLTVADAEFGCNGFVDAAAPTAVVAYEGGGEGTLVVSATSANAETPTDLVLLVRTPGGEWRCNDDYGSSDPAVVVEGAGEGDYAVWVGTYSGQARSVSVPATLTLAETAPPMPDMGMDFEGMDFGDMDAMAHTPYAEGTRVTYVTLQPDARPAVRLTAGDVAAEATADVLAEGANPIRGEVCMGYLTAAPTATVEFSGDGPLGITARAADGSDLVLLVQTPDDRWFCSDDADGLSPGVQFGSTDATEAVTAGTYRVWVGTFGDPSLVMDGGMVDDVTGETVTMEPMGPTTVTVSAVRGEIVVTEPDMGMDMGLDFPDFTLGTYEGTDLRPDDAPTTLALTGPTTTTQVTAGGALINPVDGDACAGFVDARPTFAFEAEGHAALSVTATAADDDLVMLVRTPSGTWYCSDDGEGSNPVVGLAPAEQGRHAVWVGTFSRRPDGVPAEVTVVHE